MNALAAAAPSLSDPAPRAGSPVSLSLSTASVSAALPANGFLDLINVLLGTLDSGNAYGEPRAAQPRTELPQGANTTAPQLPAASNVDIARALIRSMLGGKTTLHTSVVDGAQAEPTKAKQATGEQRISPTPLPIPTSPPLLASVPIPALIPIPGPLSLPASLPIPRLPVPAASLFSEALSLPATLAIPPSLPVSASAAIAETAVDRRLPNAAKTAASRPIVPSLAGNREPLGTGAGSAQYVVEHRAPQGTGADGPQYAVENRETQRTETGSAQDVIGSRETQGTGTGITQSVITAVAGVTAPAELAFSARLTPLENSGAVNPPVEYAPSELPAATSSDAKIKTVTQESPAPHVPLPRNNTSDATLPIAAVASASSSDGFARGFESPAPPNSAMVDIDADRPANAFGAVAEALRASETPSAASSQTAPAVTNSPVQEIAVRIAQAAMPVVDLQVTQRAGEIHVAVRTLDASLGTLLRQDLGTLTNSLERAGYRAETYVPGVHDEPLKTAVSPQMDPGTEGEPSGQGSSGRQPGESSQGQHQHRQRHHNPQDWNDEMEQQQ